MKTFSGTLGGADVTTFTHGLDWTKIIDVRCSALNGSEGYRYSMGYETASGYQRFVTWNGTSVRIQHDSTAFDSQTYRCIALFIE